MLSASRGEMPKKAGFELVGVPYEAPPLRDHAPGGGRVGVVELTHIPSVLRNLDDSVDAVVQKSPESLGGGRSSREAARHPHDGK